MPHSSADPEKDKIISIESVLDLTMEFAKDFKNSTLGRSASLLKRSRGINSAEKVEAPKSISQLVRATSVSVTVGTGRVDVVTPSVRRAASGRTNPQSSRKPDSIPERKHSNAHTAIVKEISQQEDGTANGGKEVLGLAKASALLAAPSVRGKGENIEGYHSSNSGHGDLYPVVEEIPSRQVAEPQHEVNFSAPVRTATPDTIEKSHPKVVLYSPPSQAQFPPNRTPDSPLPPSESPSADLLQLTTNLPPDFDPTISALSRIRSEHVFDLTGHVQKVGTRPVFEGTYSNVWRGILSDNNTELVAMKVLRDLRVGEIKAHRRLRREVGTWWCLRHENIVPLLGLAKDGEFGAFGAIISPWYEHGTADEYLEKHKDNISMLQRINLFWDVAKGLRYLHTFTRANAHGESTTDLEDGDITLVHGDLKPRNVLVDDRGVARICDFGLLRLIRTGASIGLSTSTNHTGTTRYLSHEMISEDARPTTASDIHALACVGMQFTYSRLPYKEIDIAHARTDYWITRAIEDKTPPATPPDGCLGIESELWELFGQCWSIEPDNRPDARTVCSFLEANHQELARYLTP